MQKIILRTLTVIFIASLLIFPNAAAFAQSDAPITPPPPRPPVQSAIDPRESEPQHTAPPLNLPPLKAVLVVGPIDGDNGTWTTDEKRNMDLAAAELQAHGVTVHKFYTPTNNWEQIKQAADGAHFFFYRGHGVMWPGNVVGGMYLKDFFVSPDMIRTGLKLHPGAIVMLYGCYTAGGSSDEIISAAVAKDRVVQYANPFFDAGAGAYYADWFGDAFKMLVQYLYDGKTLGQVYENFYDYNAASVERYTFPNRSGMSLWLDKDNWDGIRYNYAFAGPASATLESLFASGTLDTQSAQVVYLAEPSYAVRTYDLTVSSSSGTSFNWSAEAVGGSGWLNVLTTGGQSGGQLSFQVDPPSAYGEYEAQVRVWTDNPALRDSEQYITVNLQVLPKVERLNLPFVRR